MELLFSSRLDVYLAGIVTTMCLAGLVLLVLKFRQRSVERKRWSE